MKAFLKVVLLVIAAIIAVKLLPLTFALGCALAAGLLGLIVLGVSAFFAILIAAIVVVAVLSPIWIPILALTGLIALIKGDTRKSRGAPA